MSTHLSIEPHPLLDLHAHVAAMPAPLGELARPSWIDDAISGRDDALTPLCDPFVDDTLTAAVRDLLRHGGFKPSGRNKPASEYLVRAAQDGAFPTINPAIDLGNAISLHARLPISIIDLDRVTAPLRIAIAPSGTSFPFNPSGQPFDASGLVCLFDRDGVTGTPVKDAQRSKTSATTTTTLCVIWGVATHAAHGARVANAYRTLLMRLGATVTATAPDQSTPGNESTRSIVTSGNEST